MICRLCLKDEASVFNIFADRGIQFQVSEIIAKHFWFEPKPDDPISTVICDICWNKTADFNEFYVVVEEAHRLLTERFSIKVGINKSKTKETNAPEDENINFSTRIASSKRRTIAAGVVTAENYESIFDGVLDEKNEDTLDKIEADMSLPPIEENAMPFADDENDFTQYLSLDEHHQSEQDTLKVPAIAEEVNENKRLTRSGSKKMHTPTSPFKRKLCKKKSKLRKIEEKKRNKCGWPRKKASANLESLLTEAIVCDKNECSSPILIDKAENEDKNSSKCKYRSIDEHISNVLSLQCDICGSKEATFPKLLKHMHEMHKLARGYATCCGKKFYRRSLLFHHTEMHMNPDCFKCLECDKSFADKQYLRHHTLIKHQPDEAKIFGCNFCEKKFAKAYLLEQHQRKHEDRKHICEICQRGFASFNSLSAHINVIHNNYGTMCEICAKIIRGRSAFDKHVLQHQGVTLPKVQCPICGAWYKDKNSLQKHIRRHNEEGKIHKCLECGKVSPNRSALLSHKRYVHKERMFECGICKKAFKKQIGLKEHMTMHTGETLYNCPYCPRTFNSNANMHTHRKKMHPKEFVEARLKRHETKVMYPNEEVAEIQQDLKDSISTHNEHQLLLTNDDETHTIISAEKLSELVFKVA